MKNIKLPNGMNVNSGGSISKDVLVLCYCGILGATISTEKGVVVYWNWGELFSTGLSGYDIT